MSRWTGERWNRRFPSLGISIVVGPNMDPLSSTTANYLGTWKLAKKAQERYCAFERRST
ncbi:MAG TPA: hypothetical protein VMM54_02285 [Nitrospirota bacterium]|nr:hypothetical protein [Nitrospirota bacterium]